MGSSSRFSTSAVAALSLLMLPLACREAQDSVRPDAQRIPAPDPTGHPKDNPPAAERAATGSSSPGRGPAPLAPSPTELQASEDQKLAVNASLDTAKRGAKERAAAVQAAQGAPDKAKAPGQAPAPGPSSPDAATSGAASSPAAQPGVAASAAATAGAPVPDGLPLAGQDVDRATLVFSASTAGQLVPCGCSPDMRGGLPRAAALLARWRAEDPQLVYIDAGDLLFAGPAAPKSALGQQAELKAKTLAQGVALMGAAARVVGVRDLALGAAFVSETAGGVPLVTAGRDVPGGKEALVVKAGKASIPIGIFGHGVDVHPAGVVPRSAFRSGVRALREQGARLIVLVLHDDYKTAQGLLPDAREAGVDLVILGHRNDPALDLDGADPGEPPFLRVEGHGQSLLRVDLALPKAAPGGPAAKAIPLFLVKGHAGRLDDADALGLRIGMLKERLDATPDPLKPVLVAKVKELEERQRQVLTAPEQIPPGAPVAIARFVKLDASLPDDPKAKELVAAFDAAIAERNLALAQTLPAACPKPGKSEEFIVGVSDPIVPKGKKPGSCASCHETEARFWTRTQHARSTETLSAVKKQFSLDCIPCHVTGWQQPGGVCRIDKVQEGGPGLTALGVVAAGPVQPGVERFGTGRAGVQCEMCHEASSAHAIGGARKRDAVPASTCRRCHEAENSPLFDYDKYLPWVIGPGHGKRLPKGEEPRSLGEVATGHRGGPNAALREALKAKGRPVETHQ